MPTQKQIQANRLNALRSTGPRTASGRARSSRNALKTGLHARSVILPGEDEAAFDSLVAEYHDFHQPRSPEARALCDKLARGEWLSRRLASIEAKLFVYEIDLLFKPRENCLLGQAFKSCSTHLARLQHYLGSTDRQYHRDLDLLRLLEAEEDAAAAEEEAKAPAEPDLSTTQPPEPAAPTPQLASIRQIALQPGHPDLLQDCPNCRNLGYLSPNCHYVLKRPAHDSPLP